MALEDYTVDVKEDFDTNQLLIKVRTSKGDKDLSIVLVLSDSSFYQIGEGGSIPRYHIKRMK